MDIEQINEYSSRYKKGPGSVPSKNFPNAAFTTDLKIGEDVSVLPKKMKNVNYYFQLGTVHSFSGSDSRPVVVLLMRDEKYIICEYHEIQ